MNGIKIQRIWGGFLTLWGAVILLVARQFPRLADHHPGPALFPAVVGAGFVITGLLLVVLRQHNEALQAPVRIYWYRGVILLGLCLALPWILPLTGFMIPLSIVVAMVALLAGLNWWKSLLAGGITGAIIYYLFTILLRVPL